MGRLVLPLGLRMAIGGILAGYLVPMLTVGKLDVSVYVGFFGIIVFAVAFVLFTKPPPGARLPKKPPKPQPRPLRISTSASARWTRVEPTPAASR